MRTAGSRHTAESVVDLHDWVRALDGGPTITRTKQALCEAASHGDEPATWFYVEADPHNGVARLRCLSCAQIYNVADSDARWTFPHTWSCNGCNQSIAEVVYGVNATEDVAHWLVVAARCVECGEVAGLTDLLLGPTDADELIDSL
jgi:hypothetical protein